MTRQELLLHQAKLLVRKREKSSYSFEGDGMPPTLIDAIPAGKADVRLVSTRSSIEIVVEDDGPGIPLDRLEEVFAPFFRLEGSRSRETGGIGLGLSIVRQIVEAHGGRVWAENRKDEAGQVVGARFEVALPGVGRRP